MTATSATVMVIFSKVLFRKLLDHSCVKLSSQQLRGTLTTVFWRTPYGWKFYGHGSRYVLILSSRLNIMKRKSTKVPWKASPTKKNVTPHFKEHCTKIVDISFLFLSNKTVDISFLFLKQTQFLNLTEYFLT